MRGIWRKQGTLIVYVALVLLLGCSSQESYEEKQKASDKGQADTGSAESTEARSEEGVLLVPIAHLTSPREDITLEELSQEDSLAVPEAASAAAEALLGSPDLSLFDFSSTVLEYVSQTPGAVGLVPWDEVDPRVKVLRIEGKSLLVPSTGETENYPLRFGDPAGPDPKELRRIVVGGDIVLDRGLPYMVFQQHKGLDFALEGGYAAVTGRTLAPNPYSESDLVFQFTAERRGGAGTVQDYLSSADLTLANFENPVLENATWHPEEPTFTGDLRLLSILNNAGIDGVTLGNNHILDAGFEGMEETLQHLDSAGISHAGAGTDLATAREPMIFDLGGLTVGVLSYQGVPYYEWAWATQTSPGTAPLKAEVLREDIEKLKDRVDFVVVMPHWGFEYIATPEPEQVNLAHAAVDAGADIFVGDHAHWPKGIEVYGSKPVFYGTGNFLFDQSWSEETSTGIFAEAVLYKDRVIQARPVPFIILDRSQPNFLVPEAGGERALQTIFAASIGPEFDAYNAENSSRKSAE